MNTIRLGDARGADHPRAGRRSGGRLRALLAGPETSRGRPLSQSAPFDAFTLNPRRQATGPSAPAAQAYGVWWRMKTPAQW